MSGLDDIAHMPLDSDEEFLAGIRLRLNARPLVEQRPTFAIAVYAGDLDRLTHLAEEALRTRAKQGAPPQLGPRGRLIALRDRDGQARLTALIEFDDEDALRAAGPLIASEVTLERAFDLPKAANQGEGSPSNHEEDD